MARVEIASQAWGSVVDTAGNVRAGLTVNIANLNATPATTWSAVTGGTSSTAALTTGSLGEIPRYIEEGTYTLTAGSVTRRVEAVRGASVGETLPELNVPNGIAGLDASGRLIGSVRIGPTNIDFWAEGGPTDGTTDGKPTFESIKDDYPAGGVIHLPHNLEVRAATELDLTGAAWSIEGNGARIHQPTSAGKAIIVLHKRSDGTRVFVRNLRIWGAGVSGAPITIANHASAPTGQHGIIARDLNLLENVHVDYCDYGVVAGGNHSQFINCNFKNNRYNHVTGHGAEGYATDQTQDETHGNNTYIGCDFTGGYVSSLVLATGMIDASAFYSCHWGASRDCFLLRAKGSIENAIGGGTVFINSGLEYWGRSIITDEGWNTGNRRMLSRTTWINTGVSDQNATYLPGGESSTYMMRIGYVKEQTFLGSPGDPSNHHFGDPKGFEFESVNGWNMEGADELMRRCADGGVLPMRIGGAGTGWFGNKTDIYLKTAGGRNQYLLCKVESGQSVTKDKGVGVKWNDSLEALDYEVRHWDFTTGPCVGLAALPATAGLLVPVAVRAGVINQAYAYALGGYSLLAGEEVVPDRSHPGYVWPRGKGSSGSKDAALGQFLDANLQGTDPEYRTKVAINTTFST